MTLPPERRLPRDPGGLRLPPGTRNIALTLEYDGSSFAGWQRQPGQRTVQGALEECLRTVCRHEVIVRGAGRTDSGVHALAQRANFFTTARFEPRALLRSIPGIVRGGLAATEAVEVPLDWDARHDARGKVYGYRVLVRVAPSPLLQGRVWHLRRIIDRELLAAELATLPGRADWSAYRAADCSAPDPVKELRRAELECDGDLLTLRFEGSGFLKQMVRVLAGTALDVAAGRLPPGAMRSIRDSRDRAQAGLTAPACGLCLERVLY